VNQLSLPIPKPLSEQCTDASKRVAAFIAHCAGQHKRAIRLAFVKAHKENEAAS
jgi:hypothetical protein